MEKNKLYIGNISFKTNQSQLRDEFSDCGEIVSIRIIKDRKTGRSKGFAFITFSNPQGAEQALMKDGKMFDGRALKVNVALEKNETQNETTKRGSQNHEVSSKSNKRIFDWIGGIVVGLLLSGMMCFLF